MLTLIVAGYLKPLRFYNAMHNIQQLKTPLLGNTFYGRNYAHVTLLLLRHVFPILSLLLTMESSSSSQSHCLVDLSAACALKKLAARLVSTL